MRLATSLMLPLLLVLPAAASAQAQAPRVVEGNRIVSTSLPEAVFEIDKTLTYAGGQQFEMHGVADAEQHFFVELDGQRIKRLVWIHFEGFHPGQPNTYSYGGETVEHDGIRWFRGTATVALPAVEPRPDSDGARGRNFLRDKGWTLGPNIVSQRLVWLVDDEARHEVIVYYIEDLADHGVTAAELAPGGSAHERQRPLLARHHERMLAAFKVHTGATP